MKKKIYFLGTLICYCIALLCFSHRKIASAAESDKVCAGNACELGSGNIVYQTLLIDMHGTEPDIIFCCGIVTFDARGRQESTPVPVPIEH